MRLLNFRRCNKTIDPFEFPIKEEVFDGNYSDVVGFYCLGISGDVLSIYVDSNDLVLSFNTIKKNFKECKTLVQLVNSEENLWILEIEKKPSENVVIFEYKAFNYYPEDDDEEEDVNFGLWVVSILNDKEKRKRFIEANKNHR